MGMRWDSEDISKSYEKILESDLKKIETKEIHLADRVQILFRLGLLNKDDYNDLMAGKKKYDKTTDPIILIIRYGQMMSENYDSARDNKYLSDEYLKNAGLKIKG